MFDWFSHSRAPFAGERGFSKSGGLSTSASLLPSPPPLSYFSSRPNFVRAKYLSLVFLCSPTPGKCLLCKLVCLELPLPFRLRANEKQTKHQSKHIVFYLNELRINKKKLIEFLNKKAAIPDRGLNDYQSFKA